MQDVRKVAFHGSRARWFRGTGGDIRRVGTIVLVTVAIKVYTLRLTLHSDSNASHQEIPRKDAQVDTDTDAPLLLAALASVGTHRTV